MKLVHSIIITLLILVCASRGLAQSSSDSCSCNCPPPVEDPSGLGPLRPLYADMLQRVSPNNRWLAYQSDGASAAYLLDLTTLRQIDLSKINTHISGASVFSMVVPLFCPYDSDLIVVSVGLYVDTVPNGDGFSVGNLYTYRISSGESIRITPSAFGPFGIPGGAIELFSWNSGSTPLNDTLVMGSWFYIPELDTLWLVPPDTVSNIAYSRNGRDSVYMSYNVPVGGYFFDTVPLYFYDIEHASFSPDGNLVAVSGIMNDNDTAYDQVYIYDVGTHSLVKTINFQKSFCMYNLWGVYAEFLTDSTLAVSMHKDSAESSPLWEITIDGRIVRQLTFLPEWPTAGVASTNLPENSFSLISYPNPFTSTTTISFTLPEACQATLTLSDAAGRKRPLLPAQYLSAGQHEVAWDASNYPSGVYLCRLSCDGQSATRRVVELR